MAKVLFWYVFSQVCLCSLVSAGFVTQVLWVSWFRRFRTLVGFVVFFRSFVVSWFHKFRCVKGFVVTYVSCSHGFRGFNGFIGFMGFVVSKASWVSWFHRFHGFLAFMGLTCFCSFEQTSFLC